MHKIQILVREYPSKYGLSRYTGSICRALSQNGLEYELLFPHHPSIVNQTHKLTSSFGYNLNRFFTTYLISASFDCNSLKHLTTQQMACLLWRYPRLKPTIVTVHDIIPHLVKHDKSQNTFRHPFDYLFDTLAMTALCRAGQIISISESTRKALITHLKIDPHKVQTILYGVDHTVFKPQPNSHDLLRRYGLPDNHRFIVYVGSESPRKNLHRLLQAFALLKQHLPGVKLLKIGSPEYLPQHQQLLALVDTLSLKQDVIFINHPPQADLVLFYNLADVFVFPSLYEGFGLPPLEAMACGAPVITSNTSSLPEVAGEAAILINPYDVDAISAAMRQVLCDPQLAQDLRERGLARAAQFTWEHTARETMAVYKEFITNGR